MQDRTEIKSSNENSEQFPLTSTQQGMLFQHLATPNSGENIEQIVCDLYEEIDLFYLEKAWQRLTNEHAAFRTVFEWEHNSEPVQQVLADAEISFTVDDLEKLSDSERQKRIAEFLEEDRKKGFDLSKLPLHRVNVFKLGEQNYKMIWTFSHITIDGRSFPIILKDLFNLYEGLSDDQDIALETRPAFRRHIEQLESLDLSGTSSEYFWKSYLSDFTEPTPLPTPLSEVGNTENQIEAGQESRILSKGLTEQAGTISKRCDVSIHNILQGAWAVVLSQYANSNDIVFGSVRAGRNATIDDAGSAVGNFINTVPFRVRLSSNMPVSEWLQRIRADQVEIRPFELSPLLDVQNFSSVETGKPLFETLLVFDNFDLNNYLRRLGGVWENRQFELLEKTSYPLTLYGYADSEIILKINYDRQRYESTFVETLLGRVEAAIKSICDNVEGTLEQVSILTPEEKKNVLQLWNETKVDIPAAVCIHDLIEKQISETPEKIAVSCGRQKLTYEELGQHSDNLARILIGKGLRADDLVGICLERSTDLVVALLAVLKAGGAYVPLDPSFPGDRISYMVHDSGVRILLTQSSLKNLIDESETGDSDVEVILMDDISSFAVNSNLAVLPAEVGPDNLAYVIYTSGSTGKPKGVMVEHRNVVNFFHGMDERIAPNKNGNWLAVTSISFDISVLELLYTLSRGFSVVVYREPDYSTPIVQVSDEIKSKPMDFGLFYFASGEGSSQEKYKLLLEGAKFADANGFSSVSVPERHFHSFGGLFPNPSVAAAAVASLTKNVEIRAGSVVLPLHHPLRVAEEWSIVDNLSNGRVGISVASGWQPVDFVLNPDAYQDRHKLMYENVEKVRSLWRGDKLEFKDPNGNIQEVGILPTPVQNEIPIWITTAGHIETWKSAGRAGANVLTHLLGQTVEEIAEKIAIYKTSREEAGLDPDSGHVTIMLHTFVGDSVDTVRDIVRDPMKNYLKSSLGLVKNVLSSWTAYKRRADGSINLSDDLDINSLSEEELDDLLEFSFERYFETSGLFGTPKTCLNIVNRLKSIGVHEIACLIDFGVDDDVVLNNLSHLNSLRKMANNIDYEETPDQSIGSLIQEQNISHLQCTPSMLSMILQDEEARTQFNRLTTIMIGGEAFPRNLARELAEITDASIVNMYGPTETTIWSSTERISGDEQVISIGTPIANTQFYILDSQGKLVPPEIPGELYIGGNGVVRGYLNREELTAERFVVNPFSADSTARMYRTGDLACWRSDGRVNYLGRTDFQVKIRGYRIELGEIENCISELDSIDTAVVSAHEIKADDIRLVAYCKSSDPETHQADDIRKFLKTKLPDYMVPAHYLFIEEFPLTPNKKIDRAKLPKPEFLGLAPAEPQTDGEDENLESRMLVIWREVLGVSDCGLDDNFFDLGGHSLLAMKARRRISDEFQSSISIVDFFRYPTVRALLSHIEAGEQQDLLKSSEIRGQSRRDRLLNRRQSRNRRTK